MNFKKQKPCELNSQATAYLMTVTIYLFLFVVWTSNKDTYWIIHDVMQRKKWSVSPNNVIQLNIDD